MLGHRRVYIVPSRLGLLFGGALGILLRGLDQLRAVARLRAHLPARRHGPRRHGADRAQPRAAGGARRARRAGVRRRRRRASGCSSPTPAISTGPRSCVRHLASGAQLRRRRRRRRRPPKRCSRCPRERRGWLPLGRVMLETRFPLGLFRAWSYVEPDSRCLVYPRPDFARAAAARGQRRRPAARARTRKAATTSPACAPTRPPIRRATSPGSPWRAATPASRSDDMLTKQFAGEAVARAVAGPARPARRARAGSAPVAARRLGARRRARRRALRAAPARQRDRAGPRRPAPRRLPGGARAVRSAGAATHEPR